MATELNLPEIIGGIVFILGVIGALVAKHKGFITFGKPEERRSCAKYCQDHSDFVKEAVISKFKAETLLDRHGEVLERISVVETKVDKVLIAQADITGYIRGKRDI